MSFSFNNFKASFLKKRILFSVFSSGEPQKLPFDLLFEQLATALMVISFAGALKAQTPLST